MLVPARTALLLVHNTAVRRASVFWSGQTYTNRFVENALQEYR
jgi:hypothetical protein